MSLLCIPFLFLSQNVFKQKGIYICKCIALLAHLIHRNTGSTKQLLALLDVSAKNAMVSCGRIGGLL